MNRHERRAAAKRAKADLKSVPLAVDYALCEVVFGHMQAGRYLEAQLCCHKALEASPEHPELLHLMALVCLNGGQLDHAVEWASRAMAMVPKPSYLTTLGAAHLRLGRPEEAAKVFDKAVRLKPDDADLWRHRGSALFQAGRLGEALPCFQRAVELNPDYGDALCHLAMALHVANRPEEAATFYRRALAVQERRR